MVGTLTVKDADVTIRAMELGAIDFVTKPGNIIEAKGEDFKSSLGSLRQSSGRKMPRMPWGPAGQP